MCTDCVDTGAVDCGQGEAEAAEGGDVDAERAEREVWGVVGGAEQNGVEEAR